LPLLPSNWQDNVKAADSLLIRQCLQGSTAAFGELVRRYQDRLFNTVYRLLDHAEDAQDVVQEAFLNAYQNLGSFKGDSQFFTWLYRIAMNTAISLKRKQRATVSLSGERDGDLGLEPADASEDVQPEITLRRRERARKLQDALNRLSPDHRAVLVLKEIEGEKYEVIAEILEVPVGTIRSRLHRARAELRDLLGEEEF
jgi:RNA polymerase sigma-70 factor (ECF subfamily)